MKLLGILFLMTNTEVMYTTTEVAAIWWMSFLSFAIFVLVILHIYEFVFPTKRNHRKR